MTARRIVAVRVSALGDVLLATPALRALAAANPEAELHLVTDAAIAPVLDGLPYLARVHRWDARGRHAGVGGLPRFAAEVAGGGPFDLAVDLQNKIRTRALLALLRPARSVVLVKRRGIAAVARALVGEDSVLDGVHQIELYHEPLAPLGVTPDGRGLDVFIPTTAHAAADRLLSAGGPGPLVALAPGARWASKRWPAARFAEAGDALVNAGARLVLAGGPGDVRELEAIRAHLGTPPVGDTAGLDVAGLAAVLARCSVVVTCDSAPAHLAQAVGTPVVTVFGPTSPRRWGPLAGGGAALQLPLPCAPCSNHGAASCPLGHHACLARLPARPVVEVAQAALQAGRARGGDAAAAAAAHVAASLRALSTGAETPP